MEAQPFAIHNAQPIYYADELEELSLEIAAKTRELSDLYDKFHQKLAKIRKNSSKTDQKTSKTDQK